MGKRSITFFFSFFHNLSWNINSRKSFIISFLHFLQGYFVGKRVLQILGFRYWKTILFSCFYIMGHSFMTPQIRGKGGKGGRAGGGEVTKLWKLSKWLWMFLGKNGGVAFWPCAYLHVLKANILYPSYVKFSNI